MTVDALARISALESQVRSLTVMVERLASAQGEITGADRALISQIGASLATAGAEWTWTAAALLDFAQAQRRSLLAAIETALPPNRSLEIDGNSTKQLGKWLAKMEGRDVDGLRIERRRTRRGSQVWRCVLVDVPDVT